MTSPDIELAQLRSEVAALRQLIDVHETVSLTQSLKLEQALRDLEARNEALTETEDQRLELIRRLRAAVDELSIPVLEVWDDVLALPIIGVLDTQRAVRLTEMLLREVARTRCRFVIVDLTGVGIIDTGIAGRLLGLARSVSMLGAECILTGIQPPVAQTLTDLGVGFSNIRTVRNLKQALELCMPAPRSREGYGVVR